MDYLSQFVKIAGSMSSGAEIQNNKITTFEHFKELAELLWRDRYDCLKNPNYVNAAKGTIQMLNRLADDGFIFHRYANFYRQRLENFLSSKGISVEFDKPQYHRDYSLLYVLAYNGGHLKHLATDVSKSPEILETAEPYQILQFDSKAEAENFILQRL
jgi:hypothetical protein